MISAVGIRKATISSAPRSAQRPSAIEIAPARIITPLNGTVRLGAGAPFAFA